MTSSGERAVTKTYRLSRRLTVDMTVGAGGLFTCEWSPDIPRSMSRKEQKRYLAARSEMLKLLADMLGGGVAVVDLDEDGHLGEPSMIDPSK